MKQKQQNVEILLEDYLLEHTYSRIEKNAKVKPPSLILFGQHLEQLDRDGQKFKLDTHLHTQLHKHINTYYYYIKSKNKQRIRAYWLLQLLLVKS